MAITNSIGGNRASGSVGNTTYAVVKTQLIAKQKIAKTGKILPENQTVSQKRMRNIVLAYQFLAVFFSDAKALTTAIESIYNAVVRIFKNAMLGDDIYSAKENALELLGSGVVCGNWVPITVGVTAGNKWKVDLQTGGLPYIAGTNYRLVVIVEATGVQTNHTGAISEVAWAAGTIDSNVAAVAGSFGGAYIFTNDGSKCSVVAGFEH